MTTEMPPTFFTFKSRTARRFVRTITFILSALITAVLLVNGSTTVAQTAIGATWDNTGSEWTNGASWIGDNAPTNIAATNVTVGTGNVATFSNAAVGNNTVNLSVSREIYGLLFTAGANAYTFTGSNLTMNGAYGISNLSSTVQTFSNKVLNSQASGGVGSFNASGSLVFAGGIDLSTTSANRTVTFGGLGNITVGSVIANGGSAPAAGVTVTNTGLTLFSGNNTYGGNTLVSSGARLQLGNAGALGSTVGLTRVSSGGAIDLNGQSIVGEGLTNAGTGVLASGSLYNSSASAATWSGNITPSDNSTIKATNGSITLSGGIDLNNNNATSRTLTLEGAGGITVSGNISNSFAGSTGGLTIGGTNGVTTLSGSNSYSGLTSLTNTYTLRVTAVDALSSKSSLEGASSSARTPTLDLARAGSYKMNSYQGGNMNLLATNGASSLTFTNTGTGNLVVGGSRTITATNVAVTFDGPVDISPTTAAKTFTVAGNSDFTFNGAILTTNTGFSSEFRASSTGRTTLNASNNYDGLTTVSAGAKLRLANSYAMGVANGLTNTVAVGGALELLGGITVNGEILALSGTDGSLATLRNITNNNTYNGAITFDSGTNRIDSDAGTLTLSSFANTLNSSKSLFVGGAGNTVFTGRVIGNGSATLTKDGAGTLTLANTNNDLGATGGVLVNSGTLALVTNNALGATRAVAVNGGTLDIGTFNSTVGAVSLTNGTISGSTGVLTGTSYAVQNGTISAILAGSGGLTKTSAGTVTLTGNNSYGNATTVVEGKLAINGDQSSATGAVTVSPGATLAGSGTIGGATTINGRHNPGNSPGLQTFNSGLTYSTGSTFVWDLTANAVTGRGTVFDGVNVAGGTLVINTGVTSDLVFNAAGSTVNWSDAFWDTNKQWLVFNNNSSPTLGSGNVFDTINVGFDSLEMSLTSIRPGSSFSWEQIDNGVYLNYAIPEPSTYALLGVSALAWGAWFVRRRRKS